MQDSFKRNNLSNPKYRKPKGWNKSLFKELTGSFSNQSQKVVVTNAVSSTPYPNNPRHFAVVLTGPQETPYAGGVFRLELFLPEGYPMCPPKVRFLTKIYHRKFHSPPRDQGPNNA